MVKKKVLVIGGGGYLGARISLFFSKNGFQVTALCHKSVEQNYYWISNIHEILYGDITNFSTIEKLDNEKFEIVIYLVSLDQNESNGAPSFVSKINIIPVWSILDKLSHNGLKKFLYFSTTQVYGDINSEIINENIYPKPKNAYGLTHQIGELICDYYNRNSSTNCCVVRLSNSYGAPILQNSKSWNLVINDLCKSAFTENKIILESDGTPKRDFIHGWDICSALLRIIESENGETIYNISSSETYSILEIAYKISDVFNARYNMRIPVITSSNTINKKQEDYIIDNTKLKSIGFQSEWTIEEGINDIFDFLEKTQRKSN